SLSERLNGAQVRLVRRERIGRCCVKQGAVRRVELIDSGVDLVQGRHAGGENHGFASLRDGTKEGQISDGCRGNLVRGHVEIFEKVPTWFVPRGSKPVQSTQRGMVPDF